MTKGKDIMRFGVIQELDPHTGEVKKEFEADIDEEFLAMFFDALFSWARRGQKEGLPAPKQGQASGFTQIDNYKDLDSKAVFGKHRGKTWRAIVEEEPDYVIWVIDNVDKLPPFFKELLSVAVKSGGKKDGLEF